MMNDLGSCSGQAAQQSLISLAKTSLLGPSLKKLTMPILLIDGDHPSGVFEMVLAQEREARRYFPNSKLILIPNACHNLPREQPQIFAQKVLEFLNE